MSSTQSDRNGSDEQTRNCPDCGNEMEYDVIREHGCEFETTLYMGWWCSSCSNGMIHCGDCDSLHHPDYECEPQRNARIEAAREDMGGTAKIPRQGLVDIETHGTDDEPPLYVIDGGCPHCDGDLVFVLVRNDGFAKQRPVPDPEYEAVAEHCSQLNEGCSYRG
jgi:hypothetical protein